MAVAKRTSSKRGNAKTTAKAGKSRRALSDRSNKNRPSKATRKKQDRAGAEEEVSVDPLYS